MKFGDTSLPSRDDVLSKKRVVKNHPDYKKRNKLSRGRGYRFEYELLQLLKKQGFDGRRLGGSSTGLPDLVVTNNESGLCLAIECKSKDSWSIEVPDDEVERCFETLKLFEYYPIRCVVLAFKFPKSKVFKRKKPEFRFMMFNANILNKVYHVTYNIQQDYCWFMGQDKEIFLNRSHDLKGRTLHEFLVELFSVTRMKEASNQGKST